MTFLRNEIQASLLKSLCINNSALELTLHWTDFSKYCIKSIYHTCYVILKKNIISSNEI